MNGKIAIIGGTGDLGFGLALRWARAGADVLIGSRDEAKARDAAQRVKDTVKSGVLVSGFENTQACAQAAVVVLAVPFAAQVTILKGFTVTAVYDERFSDVKGNAVPGLDQVMVQALQRWRAKPGPMRVVDIYWSFGPHPWVNYGKGNTPK